MPRDGGGLPDPRPCDSNHCPVVPTHIYPRAWILRRTVIAQLGCRGLWVAAKINREKWLDRGGWFCWERPGLAKGRRPICCVSGWVPVIFQPAMFFAPPAQPERNLTAAMREALQYMRRGELVPDTTVREMSASVNRVCTAAAGSSSMDSRIRWRKRSR